MFTLEEILVFIGASLLLIIAPGPDIVFTVTQGITRGKKAGALTAIGLALGNTVHIGASALGLALFVKNYPALFTGVKTAGALYLFYLAWAAVKPDRTLQKTEAPAHVSVSVTASVGRGFFMNVLNPKVALFFLAFFPQFIHPERGKGAAQFFLLGTIFISLVLAVFGTLGIFAGTLGSRFTGDGNFSRIMKFITALVFVLIGIRLICMSQ